MSVRSRPRASQRKSVFDSTTRSEVGQSFVTARREDVDPAMALGLEERQTSNEGTTDLFKTRIRLMNTLTTTQGWIQENCSCMLIIHHGK